MDIRKEKFMGTQFFWFFDAAVIVLLLVFVFKGIHKGFVSVLVGVVAMLAAFAVALPVSGVIADAIYSGMIKDAVSDSINEQLGSVFDDNVVTKLKKVDISKAKINGKPLSEINTEADSAGKINLDLSRLDISGTGIKDIDLSAFGMSKDFDYSSVNLGSIEITATEKEEYGIEKIILASVISDNISNGTAFGSITGAINEMAESLPSFMSGIADSLASEERINDVVISILDTDTEDFAGAITDNVVKPVVLVPMRALIFAILFAIILIVLNILAGLLKGINKIPLIGKINKILGAVAGFAQGAIVIFLVCIFVQVVIALSGNELIFLNTMTIDESLLFKKIYYFEFLDMIA